MQTTPDLKRTAEVLARVGAAASLEEALSVLGQGAMLLLGGAQAAVRAYSVDGEGTNLAYWVRADGTLEPAGSADPPPASIAGQLRAGGEPRIVDDLWALDPNDSPLYAQLREQGMRSSVAVPIVAGRERIGSLHVDHPQRGYFGELHLALAEALAIQAGTAIERERQRKRISREDELRRLYREAREQTATHVALNEALRGVAEERDRAWRELDAILHTIADGVTVQDGSGEILYANLAAARMAGFDSVPSFLDAVRRGEGTAEELLDEAGVPVAPERLPGRRALAGEAAPELVVRYRLPASGDVRWSVVRARAVPDESGVPRLAVNVIHDLTERKAAEDRQRLLAAASWVLGSSLDFNQTLRDVADLAVPTLADWCTVSIVREDGVVERVASAHADPADGPLLAELQRVHPQASREHSLFSGVLRTGVAELQSEVTDEMLASAASGPEHLAVLRRLGVRSVMLLPLAARGQILGAMSLVTSRSGRRYDAVDLGFAEELARRCALAVDNARLYLAAQASLASARQALRARDEFLTVAAHELRTPTTTISGLAQLLARRLDRGVAPTPAELGRHVKSITAQTARLARVVSHMVDAAHLEDGTLAVTPRDSDLVALVRSAVHGLVHNAHFRPPVLRLPARPLVLRVDAELLSRVIETLVDNALRFSDGRVMPGVTPGPVEVTLRRTPDGARLTVRDHGVGIPATHLPHVFDRFSRAHGAQQLSGIGLGLSFARHVVGLHGGTITAARARGGGTLFTVCLPFDSPSVVSPSAGGAGTPLDRATGNADASLQAPA